MSPWARGGESSCLTSAHELVGQLPQLDLGLSGKKVVLECSSSYTLAGLTLTWHLEATGKFAASPPHDGLKCKELRRDSPRALGLKPGLHSTLRVQGDLWRTEAGQASFCGAGEKYTSIPVPFQTVASPGRSDLSNLQPRTVTSSLLTFHACLRSFGSPAETRQDWWGSGSLGTLHRQAQLTGGRSLERGSGGGWGVKAASGSRNTPEALDAAAVAMVMLAAGNGGQVDQ